MTRTRTGNAAGTVCMALALALGATACGGNSGDSGKREFVAAEELCEGAFPPAAARALETVTGEKQFNQNSTGEGVSGTAEALSEEFRSYYGADGSPWDDHDFCRVHTEKSASRPDVWISFEILDSDRLDGDADTSPEFDVYPMGRTALSGERRALVFFECASSGMNSEESPALIMAVMHMWEAAVQGRKAKEANMTVLHSAALAVARELKCEDDGGLPAAPVLRPAP